MGPGGMKGRSGAARQEKEAASFYPKSFPFFSKTAVYAIKKRSDHKDSPIAFLRRSLLLCPAPSFILFSIIISYSLRKDPP